MAIADSARNQRFGDESDRAQTFLITAANLWAEGQTAKQIARFLQAQNVRALVRWGADWFEFGFLKPNFKLVQAPTIKPEPKREFVSMNEPKPEEEEPFLDERFKPRAFDDDKSLLIFEPIYGTPCAIVIRLIPDGRILQRIRHIGRM